MTKSLPSPVTPTRSRLPALVARRKLYVCFLAFDYPFFPLFPFSSHPIYKWEANQRRQAARNRAASFAGPSTVEVHPAFEHIHEPGGFRQNYLLVRANGQSAEEPAVPSNFIEFLYLFRHFVRLSFSPSNMTWNSYISIIQTGRGRP